MVMPWLGIGRDASGQPPEITRQLVFCLPSGTMTVIPRRASDVALGVVIEAAPRDSATDPARWWDSGL